MKKEKDEMDEIKRIVDLLEEINPGYDFLASDDLVGDGLLDSYDLLMLIPKLEETFGITLDVKQIGPDDFKTPQTIFELIEKSRK